MRTTGLDSNGLLREQQNAKRSAACRFASKTAQVLINEQQLYARKGVAWADVDVPDSAPALVAVRKIPGR